MSNKKIYGSNEWKELDPLMRAEILLVSEGVKPATRTSDEAKTYYTFLQCLKQLGLNLCDVKFINNEYIVTVFKDDAVITKYLKRILPPVLSSYDIHRANGELFGYPNCCIDNYCSPNRILLNSKIDGLEEKVTNENCSEELNYRVPSMSTCEPICKVCSDLLKEYKKTLEKNDIGAAKALKSFNTVGYFKKRPDYVLP